MSILLPLALSCKEPPDPGKKPEPEQPTVTKALTGAGFVVQQGTWGWYDYFDCCDIEGLCIWNNPSSWYGQPALPPAPDQTTADLDEGRWFHLRSDEAMVVMMNAPPPAAYFNYRSYVAIRRRLGYDQPLFASLGTSLNQLEMEQQQGRPVWGEPLVLVTTMDANVEASVREALLAAGVDERTLHMDRIPLEVVYSGLDETDDLFMAGTRLALFDDPAAGEAYLSEPVTVLRLTPEQAGTPAAHPIPELPPRGSGTHEGDWVDAVDELQTAIGQAHAEHPRLVLRASGGTVDAFDCMSNFSCGGDIHDRYYGGLPRAFTLQDDPEDFIVLFGVNHARTGKAYYANFSIDTSLHLLAIAGMDSGEMVGTARAYLPDHPLVDDLFAVTVARDCTGHTATCLEVPGECPGVPVDEVMTVSFRAYLEPATGAAPIGSELLEERGYRFWPVPEPKK